MPMVTRVTPEMANAMRKLDIRSGGFPSSMRVIDKETTEKLFKRGWITYSALNGLYLLTSEGLNRLDKWKRGRIENIRCWSRITPVFYETDDCSHRAGMVKDDGDIVYLEPDIVKEMIDDGLLQYESEADAWVAPFKPERICVQEGE